MNEHETEAFRAAYKDRCPVRQIAGYLAAEWGFKEGMAHRDALHQDSIATLELENRMMRERNERLEADLAKAQQQEPVGVVNYADLQKADALTNPDTPLRMAIEEIKPRSIQGLPRGTPLYTTPPAQPVRPAVNEQMLEALKRIANSELSQHDGEYCRGIARTTIRAAEAAKGVCDA